MKYIAEVEEHVYGYKGCEVNIKSMEFQQVTLRFEAFSIDVKINQVKNNVMPLIDWMVSPKEMMKEFHLDESEDHSRGDMAMLVGLDVEVEIQSIHEAIMLRVS